MAHKHLFIREYPFIRNETHVEWREICSCGKSRLRQRRLRVRKLPKKDPRPKHRTPLKQVSDEKKVWLSKYKAQCQQDAPYQKCAMTGVVEHVSNLERHHPFGRIKERILAYVYLAHESHEEIHDRGKKAREDGWLHPMFWGHPARDDWPRPWPAFDERWWPDNLKRSTLT